MKVISEEKESVADSSASMSSRKVYWRMRKRGSDEKVG
jgi:hypothetical protein